VGVCVGLIVCGDLETPRRSGLGPIWAVTPQKKNPKIYAKIKENNFNVNYVECCLLKIALLTILYHKLCPTINRLCAEYLQKERKKRP